MNKYHTGTTPITKPDSAVRVYINACHTAYRFLLVDKQACPLGINGSEQGIM